MNKHNYVRMISTAALVLIAIAAMAFTVSYVSAAGSGERGAVSEAAVFPAGVPVPGGPGFISLSAFYFTGWPSNLAYYYNGTRLGNPGAEGHYYEAGLLLPHGATITKMVVFFLDNTESYDLDVSLNVSALDTDYGAGIAQVTSGGSSPSIRYLEDTTISLPLVDNQSNYYFIQLFLPPTLQVSLASVRIDYQYSSSLPRVAK